MSLHLATETEESNRKKFWTSKLGGWHTDLLARSFGLILYMTTIGHWGRRSFQDFLSTYPPSTFCLGVCGLSWILLGPRVILFGITLLVSCDFFSKVLLREGGSGLQQQAAEYPMFIIVPLSLLLLSWALWPRNNPLGSKVWQEFQSTFETHAVLIFRWIVLVTLFLVSFHKLNEDFFNPLVSCEQVLKGYLAKSWSFNWLPRLTSFSNPLVVVLLEGPVCIGLLLTFRRLGLLSVAVIFGMIGFCDALVVTLCVILPVIAFVNDEDKNLILRYWQPLTIIWAIILLIWLPFSCVNYQSVRPWVQPALYQSIILAIVVYIGGAQIMNFFRPSKKSRELQKNVELPWFIKLGFDPPRMLSKTGAGMAVVTTITLFWLANGFTPYLGLKFNYSFAMLSNLRVDDARWNHFLMPKWFRLGQHDGYIHVLEAKVFYHNKNDKPVKLRDQLRPGLYSPQAFHELTEKLMQARGKVEVILLLEYQGVAQDFQGLISSPEFDSFKKTLPVAFGHWLHDFLPIEGVMGCKH